MCLPKITFYFYFGFFFLGYIWVFGILFYNTWNEGSKKSVSAAIKSSESERRDDLFPKLQPPFSPGLVVPLEFRPVPYFDLKAKPPNFEEPPFCIELVSEPKFHICIHDPNLDKGISANMKVYREWEKELSNELVSVLKKNPQSLFVDVGSNIGYYSLLAAKLGHSVIAIEPFQDNLRLFRYSAKLNRLTDKIRVIPAAVSDHRGNLTFADVTENIGGRFVVATEEQKFKFQNRKKSTVRSIILDDLITVAPLGSDRLIKFNASSIPKVIAPSPEIVMKMDIQGHECFAIRGAKQFIQRTFVSAIFMEWEESRKLKSNRQCLSEMLQELQNLGYRAFTLDAKILNELDPKDLTVPQDIVWRKNFALDIQ